jgi:hypothetical protein
LIAEKKILKRITKIFSQHEMNKGAGEKLPQKKNMLSQQIIIAPHMGL